ncbi:MAG: gamma-glutamyl-gamma-aminobutyrate hydrolase family protein, partial [Acidimicrobiales bacterium]|nr:gamma-glutamyl-gamma-aminobutyrate hydrolase family protein [Acidimicrobiales bacterium]
MKPLIGITGRISTYGNYAGTPEIMKDAELDIVLVDYVEAVLASGGLPIHLPQAVDPAEFIGRIDGLILSGGADIEPKRYDAAPDPDLGPVEPPRDEFELTLAELAIEVELPTVGICRGIQVLNVVTGGTLNQHVGEHARLDVPRTTEVHDVAFTEGSILNGIYGDQHPVNSLHHQSIDRLGNGVTATGTTGDGDVEGIELDGLPIIGVQWHPEMFRRRDPLFDWLVSTAS